MIIQPLWRNGKRAGLLNRRSQVRPLPEAVIFLDFFRLFDLPEVRREPEEEEILVEGFDAVSARGQKFRHPLTVL